MSENVVETAVKAPVKAAGKVAGWAKAAPIVFVLLVFVVVALTIRYATQIRAFLAKYKITRWIVGAAVAVFASLRWLSLAAVFLLVGDVPRPAHADVEAARFWRPSCYVTDGHGERMRCFAASGAEGTAFPFEANARKEVLR